MKNGFFRVAACVPTVKVAAPTANVEKIIETLRQLDTMGVELAVFPELCVTGYTCGDLFHNSTLLEGADVALENLRTASQTLSVVAIVGVPFLADSKLLNTAVAIGSGEVCRLAEKTYLPNYNEFYERRLWSVGNQSSIIEVNGVKIGAEICEDLWVPVPPSCRLATEGAEVIVNLSASDDIIGKYSYLRSLILQQSARCLSAYVYSSAGCGESSTDLVFDGKAFVAENGTMLASIPRWTEGLQFAVADIDVEALRRDRLHLGTFAQCANRISEISPQKQSPAYIFSSSSNGGSLAATAEKSSLLRPLSPLPFVPQGKADRDERCEEIVNIQAAGLATRLRATGCRCLVVGISGGLDSTLALLVAVRAFDRLNLPRKGIIGITMPGFGTTGRTKSNADTIMECLGVTRREIPIGRAVDGHFADIGHDPNVRDVTYENAQARERTQILMDVANQQGGMVLGTGDLSELALGWATYNGDHMSMYAVNASIPKTLVKHLVAWFADRAENQTLHESLRDIIATPISPELIPADANGEIAQKTEDLVGPYELHDFFLYYTLRFGFTPRRIFLLARKAFENFYTQETILKWMEVFFRRFFNQQFKRSCMPDGPKVGSVCLSPRGDWRMPSDASSALWLAEVEKLKHELAEGPKTF